nr:NUDIX hydrolase [Actinacidiphila yeochonensis]
MLWRYRRTGEGGPSVDSIDGIEVALVHRPRYDDWSLPKGKLKAGEDFPAAAIRETREETGVECVLGDPLPSVYYRAGGRPKEVRYWAAEAGSGVFAANREVDRVEWLPPADAARRLTHDHDRPLISALLEALAQRA